MKSDAVHDLRTRIFSSDWPLDAEITSASATTPSHAFLNNPAGQFLYVYLTRFVKALSEEHFGRPFSEISVLDWGCGKGHVSKLMRDLGPKRIESCDILAERDDSAFGQQTPLIKSFKIPVTSLLHPYVLPYADSTFDVLLSVGVLEHVPHEHASLLEIKRVLKPNGLFFCFFLPTTHSWTQKLAHLRGNFYHDRFYDESLVRQMVDSTGLHMLDVWRRQLFPKNSVRYPMFRLFEKVDQLITENTMFGKFATNIEFVCVKPDTSFEIY